MRLLSGDLGNLKAITEVAKEVLNKFAQYDLKALSDIIFLLAGHGFGKTKTIFDISYHRFSILLDASEIGRQEDLKELISNLTNFTRDSQLRQVQSILF
jgi:hypothetical protein